MRGLLLTLCLATVAACTEVQTAVDNTARAGAKGVITETLATRFPQVPKELITPFTDCIIDNSDALEIREYARAAVTGVTDTTVATVRTVLARPQTADCLRSRALGSGIMTG